MARRLLLVMIAVSAAGLLTSTALVLAMRRGTVEPSGPLVPAFSLVDQAARPVDASILDARYTLMDFMFTSCPLWCPGMTQAMAHVQEQTRGTGLRLLSISIDGEHDTPEVLSDYMARTGADAANWTFATGPREATWRLAGEIGFDVSYDDATPVARPGSDDARMINHPTRLLLVGPDRRIIGMYSYLDEADLDRLIERVRALARP